MNILLVDDEPYITNDIKDYLNYIGYKNCHKANTPIKALEIIKNHPIDLIIMDIDLESDISGIDLIYNIKQLNPSISHIYLTSIVNDETISKAGKTQPDGYLTKPVNEKEIERYLTLIKSKRKPMDTTFVLKENYTYNISTKQLLFKEEKINLTKRETKLLELILKNKNQQTPSYEQIDSCIWEEKTVTNTTRRTLVNSLNNKFDTKIFKSNYSNGYNIYL